MSADDALVAIVTEQKYDQAQRHEKENGYHHDPGPAHVENPAVPACESPVVSGASSGAVADDAAMTMI